MAAAPSVASTRETIPQHTARSLSGILEKRPVFHALSIISGLSSIPLIDQMGLDGSWVTVLGQGIQNHTFRGRVPASLAAGYMVLGALKIWAKTIETPNADKTKHQANLEILDKLSNAILSYECSMHAPNFSKTSLLIRFNQIMRAFDHILFPETVVPVVSEPPVSFLAPFKSTPNAGKPDETLAQHYGSSFSSLSLNSFWLHALGLTCSAISYKIIPILKRNGEWTGAISKWRISQKLTGIKALTTAANQIASKCSEYHVSQKVAGIAAGYAAVVALKGLLSLMKAPNAEKVARTEAITTLGQLSYAMHVVETRGERNRLAKQSTGNELTTKISQIPCNKAPLVDRFTNIVKAYTNAVSDQLGVKKPTAAAESPPVVTDAPFTNAELSTFLNHWIQLQPAQKQAEFMKLSPVKKGQIGEVLIPLTNLPSSPPPGSTGTPPTTTTTTTSAGAPPTGTS